MAALMTGTLAPPDKMDRVNLQAQRDHAPAGCIVRGPSRIGFIMVLSGLQDRMVEWRPSRIEKGREE